MAAGAPRLGERFPGGRMTVALAALFVFGVVVDLLIIRAVYRRVRSYRAVRRNLHRVMLYGSPYLMSREERQSRSS